MKINYKLLIICILIPVGLGALVGFLTNPGNSFQEIIQPSFAPPAIIFPIVWTILYTLMGISSYLVITEGGDNEKALRYYVLQLTVNLIWPFLFFSLKMYILSFVWILLLIYLVVRMILEFYKINKLSAYLQIPYLLWLIFASILNLSISILN